MTPSQTEEITSRVDSLSNQYGVAGESSEVLDLLLLLKARKRVIAFVTIGAAFLGLATSFLFPNMYEATTSIMPPQQSQSASTALLGQLAPLASLAGKDLGVSSPTAVYVALLKSRTIQDELIKRFNLVTHYRQRKWSDVRKKLEVRSQISEDRKSSVITVAVEDESPQRAADIANAYIQELSNLTKHLAVTEAARRRLFFQGEVEHEQMELISAEDNLRQTQEKTGLIQLDNQAKVIIEGVARVRGEISAKEVELQAIKSFATEQNSDYLIVQQELDGLRAQLAKLTRDKSANGELGVPVNDVPEAGLQYLRSLRDVKYHEMLFEVLAKQFEAAKIDEAKDASIIQVIDYATPPDSKQAPSRLRIVGVTTILVFLLTCAGVVYYERWITLTQTLRASA